MPIAMWIMIQETFRNVMQSVMGLLLPPHRIGTSARPDCMKRWFMAVDNVGCISQNRLASLFLLPPKLNIYREKCLRQPSENGKKS